MATSLAAIFGFADKYAIIIDGKGENLASGPCQIVVVLRLVRGNDNHHKSEIYWNTACHYHLLAIDQSLIRQIYCQT